MKRKNKSSKLSIQKQWCTETKTENNMDISEYNSNVAQLSSGDSIFKNERVSMQEKIVLEQENVADTYDRPNIAVSLDGTGLTRGHTSQIGVGCVVDTLTGHVIDYEIMSKYCPTCIRAKNELGETTAEYDVWHSGHKNSCQINYFGTSGAMKMKAAAKFWYRSEACDFRNTTLLSDGDANTYKFLNSLKIFGPDVEIPKEECIDHTCMSSRHHIDDFMSGRIIGKIEEGRKITDVAREFDIAHSVVSRLWKSIKTIGMCSRRHGEVVLEVRRLQKTDISSYQQKGTGAPQLSRQYRIARLQWCREHHNWTEQDWACLLFSDESRFSLSSDCRRQLIWHESGTAYRPGNIPEKDRYPKCSIMVWAGIMINGRTRLHVVANGTMTGQRYIDEVLLPHVRLFRGAVGDKFVFRDDNATCHRTLAVQDCLDSEGIQRLVWPARSPDLNPIESVWDALGRQVSGRNYPPKNKNTLILALTEEWDKLPQQLLHNVVQIISVWVSQSVHLSQRIIVARSSAG
ncbi:transposable element Tcb2 transposase [Trichonephila clavipes]|nr:transposable element Tcb2 transposase [Trichonephila clavipes]